MSLVDVGKRENMSSLENTSYELKTSIIFKILDIRSESVLNSYITKHKWLNFSCYFSNYIYRFTPDFYVFDRVLIGK